MITQAQSTNQTEIVYPDCDGEPMSDNTKQFRWIVTIKEGLEWLFKDDANVFVAGDLLWYPVEGDNVTRAAPDAMVIIGRPKGDRGSYQQWKEGNIAPQVVFEVRSPGNTQTGLDKKLVFYDRYGVEEYYLYDPDKGDLSGWLRREGRLDVIDQMIDWVSPRLGIKFNMLGTELQLYRPDGEKFATYVELATFREQEKLAKEQAQQQLERSQQQLEQSQQQLEQEKVRSQQLAAKLRELGIDPN
ncbi:MAG: Uma2 family endonuclease [Chroococcus sp. CMT-3BRIN-NPC107]|jgi:Uma2 family endonuclease|nr:Uma2 family endonuclease [Chroococcus sp. CMT-3BRIN-NPC107]